MSLQQIARRGHQSCNFQEANLIAATTKKLNPEIPLWEWADDDGGWLREVNLHEAIHRLYVAAVVEKPTWSPKDEPNT